MKTINLPTLIALTFLLSACKEEQNVESTASEAVDEKVVVAKYFWPRQKQKCISFQKRPLRDAKAPMLLT